MDTTAVETTAPDFGVFGQLADYGPLGLALGYVAWLFIKRYLDENKKMKEELVEKKTTRRKTRK